MTRKNRNRFLQRILRQIDFAPDKHVSVRVGKGAYPLDAALKKRPHRLHDTVEV
jgi:hypothetical protein